ncbi:uncharacterized protein LOC111409387 [Olea europaea var. sylvestris]|uniref:uncharacterized protein LOC111409387 n=1 Tax=Olea europaea var. sylvestris TaxID=158386 RepID=UPI000C1D1A39|nr:uncharacterized protein LOC111409387 [Olea europaea var. sylvestris]
MTKNIHLAQELMRQYSRKRVVPRCLLKIDISKAFDSVSWDFLKSVLEGLNFPLRFVQWIMECVTTPTYSVALNGSMYGFFKGGKGLRQGDPLSPFLFVICLEYFSRIIKDATNDSDFKLSPKMWSPQDLMLFARGDAIIGFEDQHYESSIYTAGIFGYELQTIMEISKFSKGTMPFRYLGIPLASEKLKVSSYAPFLEKIAGYIGAWSCASLSYAGKLELIRAVLQGVECFWLSIFPISATIISRIVSLCRNFLWGSKKPLVAWKNLCLPKAEGGLGLKDLKTWNLVLLAKFLWNIHKKKDTLWIRWVHHAYLNGTCIWEVRPKKDHSPLFKKLLEIRDFISAKEAAQHTVFSRQQHETVAHHFQIDQGVNGNTSTDGRALNGRFFGAGSALHDQYSGPSFNSISGRQTALFGRQFFESSTQNLGCSMHDKFSTKIAYDYFRHKGTLKPWEGEVWKPCITPKHSFLLWLAAQSKLLTKDKLLFLDIDRRCVFCRLFEETCDHLFFKCSFTSSLWGSIRSWLGITRSMSTLAIALKWMKKENRGTSWLTKTKRVALASTVYYIWLTRNRMIFEDLPADLDSIARRIKTHVYKVMFTLYPDVLILYESLAMEL